MDKRLLEALNNVSMISKSAEDLVRQVKAASGGDPIVKQLEAKIIELSTKLHAVLTSSIQHDEVLTDRQISDIREAFIPRLKDVDSAQLAKRYDRLFFGQCEPQVRKAFAVILLNEATVRNIEPAQLWQDIFVSNGEL